ncbi:MAG: tetratricopeptide repeat protein [Flavobacterium sp.]|nr:tetratricopeptide repeat protein [Flavobacterium sp.]
MKVKSSENQNYIQSKSFFFVNYKWAFLPILLALLVYSNTTQNEFALDDGLITQDSTINQGLKNIGVLFTQKTLPDSGNIKPYRPITSVSFALDYSLFKSSDVKVFASKMHHMQLLYYAFAIFLTFVFVKKLFKSDLTATAIASIFAIHPIHTEVVANIKSRDEILAYIFGLLALIFHLKFKDLNAKKWLIGSIIFYFLATLSKENALLFIVIIPFLHYFTAPNKLNIELFNDVKWYLVPAILFLFLQKNIIGNTFITKLTQIDNMLVGIPNGLDNFATRIYLVGLYLYKIVILNPLLYDYSINYLSKKTFLSPEVWVSMLVLISLLTFIYKGVLQKSKVAFGFLFMVIMFALTCNLFIQIGATFAERFAFTPSLGFAIALVYTLIYVAQKINLKIIYVGLVLLPLGLLYSFKTYQRNFDWKNNDTLFTHDYNVSAKSFRIQNNYATVFYERAKNIEDQAVKQKKFAETIVLLDTLTSNYAGYIEAYVLKGICYLELKDCKNAISNFEQAKKMSIYIPNIESNLGTGYINCEQSKDAIPIFQKLLQTDPLQEQLYLRNLGVAYYNIKNTDSAKYFFNTLKEKYPDNVEVDNYLKLFSSTVKTSVANVNQPSSTDNKVVTNSNHSKIDFNEAYKFYQSGNKEKAKQLLLVLTKKDKNFAMSFSVLGLIADEKNDFAQAENYYKTSLSINPSDYRIYYNLGNTQTRAGKKEEAIKNFERCLKLNPTYANPYKALIIYYKSINDVEKSKYYEDALRKLSQ